MTTTQKGSLQPKSRTIDGLSIRFAESEDQGLGTHALLLSPWPKSLFAFEAMWSRLAARAPRRSRPPRLRPLRAPRRTALTPRHGRVRRADRR
jgi:hypothetical protein